MSNHLMAAALAGCFSVAASSKNNDTDEQSTQQVTPLVDEPQQYVGVSIVKAVPMTRDDYNELRGWATPPNEDGTDEGYLTESTGDNKPNVEGYEGYLSWTPKENFENTYKPADSLVSSVGETLIEIPDTFVGSIATAYILWTEGHCVTRKAWEDLDMYVYLVPAADYPAHRNTNNTLVGRYPDDMVSYNAYLALHNTDGTVSPWTPTQDDMQAKDWRIRLQPIG